jgi:alpha-methylacyl-CoA racemase
VVQATGPLAGIKVLEFAGMGPVPFAAMLLADAGADVVLVHRPGAIDRPESLVVNRSRRSITADLKSSEDLTLVCDLIKRSDIVVEGFRPGVMERLGLGPVECELLNPRLVYGRMSGWGRNGPYADRPGHDINYVGVTGLLNAFRRFRQRPVSHTGIVGDYGGGSVFAFGLLAALSHARECGRGQVVDGSILGGAALMSSAYFGMRAAGKWSDEAGTNYADTGSAFYDTYECSDGKYVAVGPFEPEFYRELCITLGLDDVDAVVERQYDSRSWEADKAILEAAFLRRTRDEWAALFDGVNACVTPVLSFGEAPGHPQLSASGTYIDVEGVLQPAPTPRFSRTPSPKPRPAPHPDKHNDDARKLWLQEGDEMLEVSVHP